MDNFRRYLKLLVKRLASMQTAIYLLLIIGAVSALGTIIPQRQASAFYMEYYGKPLASIISSLGLDHLYQVWWFLLLNVLLSLSILACAYQRLFRARRIPILASLLLHLSLLIIIIGAIWSLGLSHDRLLEVKKGESISLSEYGFSEGKLTLNDFKIDYYPDFQPRQYISSLSLSGYKGQNYEKDISVNQPLKAGSLKIYQSNWGWIMQLSELDITGERAICLKEGESYLLDEQEGISIKPIFLPDFVDNKQGIHSKSPVPNNPHLWLTAFQGDRIIDMAIIPLGEDAELASYKLCFGFFCNYSGLHIKQDSGVYLVFAGFILLLGGLGLRYGSEYWGRRRPE